MNPMEFSGGLREASLRYMDGEVKVIRPGAFVRCAITAQLIPIADLKYWSVARQEAYVDAAASLEAEKRAP